MIMKSKTMTLTQLSPNYLPDSNHSIRPPILVTGGFDPLHSGHIDYFNAAKDLGEILIKFKNVLMPEINSGQLSKIIRAEFLVDVKGLNLVRGKPISSADIQQAANSLIG